MRISEETHQKVLAASRELNYHPDASARRLVRGRTQVIGYVECQSPYQAFADAFLPEVLRGLHEAARQENYHVLFEPIPPNGNSSDSYSRLIRERQTDGIVLSGPRFDDEELLRLHEEGVPVVLQGQLPGADIPFVDVDSVGGARLAAANRGSVHLDLVAPDRVFWFAALFCPWPNGGICKGLITPTIRRRKSDLVLERGGDEYTSPRFLLCSARYLAATRPVKLIRVSN